MVSQAATTAAAPSYDGAWAVRVGTRLAGAFVALVVVGAALTWVLSDAQADRRGPAPVSPAAADETAALRRAIADVMTAAAMLTAVRDGDGQPGKAEAAAEDAWLTLAVVSDRVEAQLAVAAGERAPLMGAPPPLPGRSAGSVRSVGSARERALVRSALPYVRAATVARDTHALERAATLLELAHR